jgi:hypothetical protein
LTGQYRGKLTVTDENEASNSTYFDISILEPSSGGSIVETPPANSISLDYNVDRSGWNYRRLILNETDPKLCADACADDPDCKAFSYNANSCQLKNAIPSQVAALGVISGAKTSTADTGSISNYWGHYSAKGPDFFTGYIDGLLYEQSNDKTLKGCRSKVLINEKNEKTVTSQYPVILSDGYQLALKNIDPEGNKVYLELTKNGEVVDSKVITPSKEDRTKADETYYYKNPQVGQQKKLITIAVHFKNAFRGADDNLGTVDAIWQISDATECD